MFQYVSPRSTPRRAHLGVVATLLVALTAVATPLFEQPASAVTRSRAEKFEVCHRTNAIKNPYRRISVAWSAVKPGGGHDKSAHQGPVFSISAPTATHGTTPRDSGLGGNAGGGNDRWGDIFRAVPLSGSANEYNWTAAGQAIFGSPTSPPATFTIGGVTKVACKAMSAIDYINSEREENPNITMLDIMKGLDEMEAAEDAALKTALGGSTGTFESWFNSCTVNCSSTSAITSAITAKTPQVTTEAPMSVSTGSTSNAESATLKGTVSPFGATVEWYFEFDDDSDFTPGGGDTTDVQEVTGSPNTTNSATSINVAFNATALNASKTYYYRTVGVASSGSGETLVETYLYGVTKQFSFTAPPAPVITGATCGDTSLSIAFTQTAPGIGTITNYEYSVDGGQTFAALSPTDAASPISITGLVNGTQYSVVIRAVTASETGAESAALSATPCGVPSSTTTAATSVLSTTATLNGHLTGNGTALASITFTWGTTDPTPSPWPNGSSTAVASSVTLLGTANASPVSANLTGLTPGTRYYFEVSGTYASGVSTTRGGILYFDTPTVAVPPTATTDAATNVEEKSATLNGTGTSNGASSTLSITWGTSPTLASGNTTVTPSQSPLSSNASNASITYNLTGLTGGITYYFRVTITNTNGTANGIIRSFTTPSTVTAASTGAIAGTVWIDTDGDEQKDASEVWIPGITLALSGTATGTETTNSSGAFTFTSLAAGSYKVKATLPSGLNLMMSSDSQGSVDWEVTVIVVAGQTARANFAARGNLEATGKIESVPPGTEVNVDWSGVDKNLDTVDDVTFTTKVKSDQTFELQNIPSGKYRVRAQAVRQVISVTTAGATFENTTLSFVARVPQLPATGSTSQSTMIPWALAMIPLGVLAVATSRRRRVR